VVLIVFSIYLFAGLLSLTAIGSYAVGKAVGLREQDDRYWTQRQEIHDLRHELRCARRVK
jgi:hypothetical protein